MLIFPKFWEIYLKLCKPLPTAATPCPLVTPASSVYFYKSNSSIFEGGEKLVVIIVL